MSRDGLEMSSLRSYAHYAYVCGRSLPLLPFATKLGVVQFMEPLHMAAFTTLGCTRGTILHIIRTSSRQGASAGSSIPDISPANSGNSCSNESRQKGTAAIGVNEGHNKSVPSRRV